MFLFITKDGYPYRSKQGPGDHYPDGSKQGLEP